MNLKTIYGIQYLFIFNLLYKKLELCVVSDFVFVFITLFHSSIDTTTCPKIFIHKDKHTFFLPLELDHIPPWCLLKSLLHLKLYLERPTQLNKSSTYTTSHHSVFLCTY